MILAIFVSIQNSRLPRHGSAKNSYFGLAAVERVNNFEKP